MKKLYFIFFIAIICSCKDQKSANHALKAEGKKVNIENAEGFSIEKFEGYSILKVKTPWPEAEKPLTYLLADENAEIPENIEYDEKIQVPVESIVVTSTTHIPALEALNEESSLVGFPGLNYVSSTKTRKLISEGKIAELGQNENLNTEVLINTNPDLVVGFAINGANKALVTVKKTGIPVIYNGDWTEQSPLGKAEWIKFFGALFGKEKKAAEIFNTIKKDYLKAREVAATSTNRPTVITGSMFKDQWYMPYGNSWQAQFFKDANANYLYSETKGNGSLSLSFESVLNKAEDADFWISSGQFTSYEQLLDQSPHYQQFKAVRDKNVYSVSLSKGETGGILFYELGPQRPDLVLKDLISIFHPKLLENYEPVFYKPLQ
ncbi:ABC transporter substrate-binding protein [Christiangramia fulva]|uniref:ABC transporter substrate-binding protein n=1 Tax=Christiangramia fulva TaxID=2126553 RepID=A0A2R3Z8R8_9FLAO|nr:ABC transporter substrate-binding protein [Christiangramia fulva]AVR46660.1 ABC transporter substrate-binding protein [Christiangramia fulva]